MINISPFLSGQQPPAKLVMVAVIFRGETLRDDPQSSIDVLRKYFYPDAEMPKDFCSVSNGEGRVFTFGSTCVFRRKTIHCCYCSTSVGEITSGVLAKMLQQLDELQVYNQTDGRYPCNFLNANNSRLNIPFLQYTSDKGHT